MPASPLRVALQSGPRRRLVLVLLVVALVLLVGLGTAVQADGAPAPTSAPPALSARQDARAVADAAGLEPGAMAPLTGVPAGWSTSVHRFGIGGITRSYLELRPAATSPTVLPVVVVLHGRGMTPASIERLTGMPRVTGPAIIVYPAGFGRSWNAGGCCGEAHEAGVDDVAFLTATVHQVLTTEPDSAPTDVYLVGFSNGARMAYQLACQEPGRWAGIGAVEAVPASTCQQTTPVPIVIIANPSDPYFSLERGGTVVQGYHEQSVVAVVDDWRRLDGCTGPPTTRRLGITVAESWDSCRGNGEVTYAVFGRPGHYWPEEVAAFPGASELTWSLLRYDRIPAAEGQAAR